MRAARRRARAGGTSLRLYEVGLRWPAETFIMLKLRSLAEHGVDVRVGSFANEIAQAAEAPGITLERLPEPCGGTMAVAGLARDLLRNPRGTAAILRARRRGLPFCYWRLYLHLVRCRPDVLQFEWLTVASRCLPLMQQWDGPIVVGCQSSELTAGASLVDPSREPIVRAVFARADAIRAVSAAKRDEGLPHGLDPSKTTVIRPAVDAELFRPPARRRGNASHFRVVSIGWLRWLKGYEYALRAISELARSGVPVTLDVLGGDPPVEVGEPSQRVPVLHTARELGLEDRIQMHGHVPPQEVAAHLQRADALLHMSLTEGLPNAVVEGMACGLPVVATDVGGTREAVTDGIDGFLVRPRDPQGAAAVLQGLWQDPDLRARIGLAARARVMAKFTIERQTSQWLQLYGGLAA